MPEGAGRLRLAELTSTTGALVAGIGLGAIAGPRLRDLAIPVLVLGALAHAWGMYDKHRLERDASAPEVAWHKAAYWSCWALLAGGALTLLATLAGLL